MERVKVYCRENCRGEATMEQSEGRVEIRVAMDDPADGLYRATLVGTRGQMALGIMESQKESLILRRRPWLRDVERLGEVQRVQVNCAFPFRGKCVWQEAEQPSKLVDHVFLKERLASLSRAWWRREGGKLFLALPLEKEEPFPLEALFCFGKIDCVEGRRCVVYAFDSNGMPL